ncbi:MAG TPA: hypothetical protein VGV13_04520 [Methylomirabilota bacterium]|jgi:hypothetical protein|nr:hypothetical protein [Methylomirabilota bacterium]
MRIFRPEVEAVLKTLTAILLVALVVLPFAWGYEQRRQARTWQTLACTYRMREIARRVPLLAGADSTPDPCGLLRRLGVDLEGAR